METTFVDTSFLVARFNVDDENHEVAVEFIKEMRETGREILFVISDYVFDETLTTILYQSRRHDVARNCGEILLRSPTLSMVWVDERLLKDSWELFKRRPDKMWSFTDCTSFTIMDNMDLGSALTFDENFKEAGFVIRP